MGGDRQQKNRAAIFVPQRVIGVNDAGAVLQPHLKFELNLRVARIADLDALGNFDAIGNQPPEPT